jgi:hypothetical protein
MTMTALINLAQSRTAPVGAGPRRAAREENSA